MFVLRYCCFTACVLYGFTAVLLLGCLAEHDRDRNQRSVCCGCIALLLFYYCAALLSTSLAGYAGDRSQRRRSLCGSKTSFTAALLSTSLYCCVQGMKEAEKPKEVAKPVVAAKPADDKPVAKKIDLTDE